LSHIQNYLLIMPSNRFAGQCLGWLAARRRVITDEKKPMRAPWADIAPKLTEISDQVLFDDVWRRPGLSPRDRSLITVASLIAGYRQNELPFHLRKAVENGVTRDEIIEAITHLAFYAGWPTASTALGVVRQVFADSDKREG
jgi:4-carboxymuconolactone decarboxylase